MASIPVTVRVEPEHRDLIRETGRRLRLGSQFAQSLRDLLAAQGGGGVVQLVEQVALLDLLLSMLSARVAVMEQGAAVEGLNSTGPGSEK